MTKLLKNNVTNYQFGYSSENCRIQGINPEGDFVVASPFVEQIKDKKGDLTGLSVYVYQDSKDEHGRLWQHQPIKVKVSKLESNLELGDIIQINNLMGIRIIVQNEKSKAVNYYYKADTIQLVKGGKVDG